MAVPFGAAQWAAGPLLGLGRDDARDLRRKAIGVDNPARDAFSRLRHGGPQEEIVKVAGVLG